MVLVCVTHNWKLAVIALFTILCIVTCIIGMFPVYGWKISTTESFCCIVVIGLAVDYCVHLCHSYHLHSGNRHDKVMKALSDMGVSVVSGALTTMGAGFFLLQTSMTFFQTFGSLMVKTVCFSWVISVIMLMSILYYVGPIESEGEITFLKNLVNKAIAEEVASPDPNQKK